MNYVKTAVFLASLTALFLLAGFAMGGAGGAMIAFFFALGTNALAYWNADKAILRIYGAKPISRNGRYGTLLDRTAQLCVNADLPLPKLYVIETAQPNAFATGRNPKNAAVAVTTGLLRVLNDREVDAVIAHELAHVKNHDTLIMTITATISGAVSMLASFSFFFGGRSRNANPLFVILMAILAPIAAMLVQMAISRTREYAADKMGAAICRDPLMLAFALEKISGQAAQTDNDLAEENPATAHMFIVNPLRGKGRDSLFATHPDVQNRIAALREIANSLKKNSSKESSAGAQKENQKDSYAENPWRRRSFE